MSPREMLALFTAAVVALASLPRTSADPVTSCTTNFGEFIADKDDLCVYYQCVFGSPVLRQCAKGTRMPSYYQISTSNPCTRDVSQSKCLRCDINDTVPAQDPVSTICQQRPFLCAPCGCVNQVAGYWCNCSATVPTLPPQPSDPVPLCAVNVCLNGGTCNKLFDEKPLCLCAAGYTGDLCQNRLCDYNPCLNGGTCVANGTSIHCNCVNCFTGTCCENPDPNCGATPAVTTVPPTVAPTCDPCHYGAGCSQVKTWLCSCNPCPAGQACSDTTTGSVRSCAAGSASDQFTLVFEENWLFDNNTALEIYATAAANDGLSRTVRAYARYGVDLGCPFDQTQTIPAGQVYKFNVPRCLRHDGTGEDLKGIRVVETGGKAITVYAINRAFFSADSWLALPDSKASKNFVALTYSGYQTYKSECTIVAIYNNTQISMYLSVDTDLPSSSTAGSEFTTILDEFHTYQVQAVLPQDMSGTVFVSTKPVHVTCGVVRAYVPPNPNGPFGPNTLPAGVTASRDALVEEMVGTDYWSTTFAVVPITRQVINYTYTEVQILIAGYTNTQCSVYSTNTSVVPATISISGPYYVYKDWYDASADYFINCSYPVLVEELSLSAVQGINNLDDPSLMYVPGVAEYTNFYQFGPPTYSVSNGPYTYVYAKLAARDVDYAAITIGNLTPAALKPWRKLNVPSNPDTANYPSLYGGVFKVPNTGTTAILHPNSSVKFMCIVYAFDNRESIGHVAGLSLSTTNSGLAFDVVANYGG